MFLPKFQITNNQRIKKYIFIKSVSGGTTKTLDNPLIFKGFLYEGVLQGVFYL